jgi:hypothetical protein
VAKRFHELSEEEKLDALLHAAKHVMAKKRVVASRRYQVVVWGSWLIAVSAAIADVGGQQMRALGSND